MNEEIVISNISIGDIVISNKGRELRIDKLLCSFMFNSQKDLFELTDLNDGKVYRRCRYELELSKKK